MFSQLDKYKLQKLQFGKKIDLGIGDHSLAV